MSMLENENKISKLNIEDYKNEIKEKLKISEINNMDYLNDMSSIWFENIYQSNEVDEDNSIVIKELESDDDATAICFLYESNDLNANNIADWIQIKINSILILIKEEILDVKEKYNFFCFFKDQISQNKKRDITYALKDKITSKIELEIIDIEEVAQKSQNLKLQNATEFTFKCEAKNILKYEIENINSLVLNISAKSLQAAYQKYGKNSGPLYSENLRYHVKDKKVDTPIEESIKNESNKFWFKNNGIVIITDEYKLDEEENEITLFHFSIINGGQTTFMIGETYFEEDFVILAKILISSKLNEDEKTKFIEQIAISTNKQKQIKDKDLISNSNEVRTLNSAFREKNYLLKYKRGQLIPDKYKNKLLKNYLINIDEVGQIYLAIFNQEPGSAKSSKNKIWNPNLREVIFDKNKVNFYINAHELLTKLIIQRNNVLKEWKKDNTHKGDFKYLNTGIWFIYLTMISCYWIKENINNICNIIEQSENYEGYIKQFKNIIDFDQSFNIRLKDSDIDNQINRFMIYINSIFVKETFQDEWEKDNSLQFSNWTKTNKNFFRIIRKIFNKYSAGSDKFPTELEIFLDAIFEK